MQGQTQQQQYNLSSVVSNRGLFTTILLNTLDINNVNQAQALLASFDQENTEQYCLLLSEELANEALGATPSREIAGQQLKNMLSAKGDAERKMKTERWMMFQQGNRKQIIDNVKLALRSTFIQTANSAAASLSAIGVIEIPANIENDIINTLLENIRLLNQAEEGLLPQIVSIGNDQNTQMQNPGMLENLIKQHKLNMKLKRASIICLRFLCEDLPVQCLTGFQDTLLTIIVSGSLNYSKAYRDDSDDDAEVEALRALLSLLPAIHERFSQPGPRQLIIPVVINPLQAFPDPDQPDYKFSHRRYCYQCLNRIAELYYPYLTEYAELLFTQTLETIQRDSSDIVPLAIELWNVIADFESSLQFRNSFPKSASEFLPVYFKDVRPSSLYQGLCEKAADQLTNLMFTILLTIPADSSLDDWNEYSAAVMLVSTLYSVVHSQDLFNKLSTFASQNLVAVSNNGSNVITTAQLDQIPAYNYRNTAIYVIGLMVMGTRSEIKNFTDAAAVIRSMGLPKTETEPWNALSENVLVRREHLLDYVKSNLHVLLKGMLEDDTLVVRNTAAWSVQWICSEFADEICPQDALSRTPQPLWELLVTSLRDGLLSGNVYVARHCSAAVKNLAKSCRKEIAKKPINFVSQMLTELYDALFKVIEEGWEGNASRVAQIATLAMEKVIQNTGAASRQFLSQKVRALLEYMVANPNQSEQTIIAELMVIRASTLRMEYSIQSHTPLLHTVIGRLTQSQSVVLQESLLSCLYVLAGFLNPVDTTLFENLIPYLTICLQSDTIPGVQNLVLEVIAMFGFLYSVRFEKFLPILIPEIFRIFNFHAANFAQSSFSMDRKVFPAVMDTLSDICVSTPKGFLGYIQQSLTITRECLKLDIPNTATLDEEKDVFTVFTSALSFTSKLFSFAQKSGRADNPFLTPSGIPLKDHVEQEEMPLFVHSLHTLAQKIMQRCAPSGEITKEARQFMFPLVGSDFLSAFIVLVTEIKDVETCTHQLNLHTDSAPIALFLNAIILPKSLRDYSTAIRNLLSYN
ncbi:putative armadillo-type protein [Blattamonas nauphoetae]|uniref:Armadillo-type protein n=1 Tax=Blattamonas nauphoetae TaxID=2049346 RepID=A0ABQ9XVX1_9EUKA|nr:putative armadillo-type protein [Blattamonas nauphoetae]